MTDSAPALAAHLDPIGEAFAHESATLHVSGAARYTDDIPEPRETLHAAIGTSRLAHGRIRSIDTAAVRAHPGVVDVITASGIPGANDVGSVIHDDPILADGTVQFVGQPVFAVVATSIEAARKAARIACIECEPLPAILTIEEALAAQSFVLPSERLVRGDPSGALAVAPHRLGGEVRSGGQDHFYLEGQISFALPRDDGGVHVYCSTQHPTEVQFHVAHALAIDAALVSVECRRMGGGFGGKESQSSLFACIAAIFARRTGRPVKLRLDRDDDMISTGKRHAYYYRYDVGFDDAGRISALAIEFASRCGFSADLSGPVNDRTIFHIDNCYYLPNVSILSHRCRTNTVSDTAFRGFGGPQGMFAIEHIIDVIAARLQVDPLAVRRANFYGTDDRNETPYGMRVEDNVIGRLVDELEASSGYSRRRAAIREWNRTSPIVKRGIALTPVKFGISFTATFYNQAGALLQIYKDGSVLVNHGGTEMGQGLHTKIAQVVAAELALPLARIRVSGTDTSKVPNTSATAASSGTDLNGMAAQRAAGELRRRLTAFAATCLGIDEAGVRWLPGRVEAGTSVIAFDELVARAYRARIQLSATGFYTTPKIHYDRKSLTGRPFYYFAYGAAVSEVAIDTLTGENRLLGVDILHDVGRSINPALDRGQIEGGFLQGYGWLTMEALWWNARGELKTHSPSTYKIPTCSDWPRHFRIGFLANANVEDSIHRSKAVGEPPLMLAISAFHAIRDAIAAAGDYRVGPELDAPATNEAILWAVDGVRAGAGAAIPAMAVNGPAAARLTVRPASPMPELSATPAPAAPPSA